MTAGTVAIPVEVHNDVYLPFRLDQTPLQIFFGGSSSGKSVFVAERTIEDVLDGGRNFLAIRNVGRTLRSSVFNEFKRVINEWDLHDLFDINLSEMTITCKNGYQIIFKGLDDPEKIKSIVPLKGVITDIWIEEATEVSFDAFKSLTKRLRGLTPPGIKKRIVFTFNPILKSHWIYKSFFKNWNEGDTLYQSEKVLILKTTYKDNNFLEDEDKARLEDETDSYYYNVYTLGNWGVLGNLIFTNWVKEDIKNNKALVETFDKFKHGLDFGYTNHPSAYNKLSYHPALKHLYIIDEWNEKGASNQYIAESIYDQVKNDMVVCDSAEPKSITELNANGISAVGARKGKDSIIHGIQWLKTLKIFIDLSCQHTINEFEQYHWKENKDGESLNEPVDKDNHHIDAIRYAMEDEMLIFHNDEVEEIGELETADIDW